MIRLRCQVIFWKGLGYFLIIGSVPQFRDQRPNSPWGNEQQGPEEVATEKLLPSIRKGISLATPANAETKTCC